MKEGWKELKITEVIVPTETIDPRKLPEVAFKYIDISSVNNETLKIENTSLLKGKDAPSRARKLVKTNDILFATVRPTLKRIAIISEENNEQVCSTGYFVFRPMAKVLNHKYLFYFLQTDRFISAMEKLQKGASYPAVTDSQIRNETITLPDSLSEQQRIVSILDEAFAAIDKAKANIEKNLANAKELFQSELNTIFSQKGEGWVTKILPEVVAKDCTLSYGIVQPGEEFENGIPVVRPTDLTSKYILEDGLKRVDPSLTVSYKRTQLIGNELLLCVRGSTGVIAIASDGLNGANVTRGIVPIRFNEMIILLEFAYYMFLSPYVQRQIKERTYGAALMQINIADLRKLIVNVPSIKNQKAIISSLDTLGSKTTKLIHLYQEKVDYLQTLKKSILQKAFAGELTESFVADEAMQ